MWIERLRLDGFAGISRELVELSEHEVNLIIEPNEYGKSTLAECIWATLFDFPHEITNQKGTNERNAFRPFDANAPYRASLDLTFKDRPIQVVRDFAQRKVQVFDLNNNQEITNEFLGPAGEDHVGLLITGMSRDLFRSTCLLGQRHLDKHHAANQADIAQVFQGMADTANPTSSSSSATESLNEALANYTYSNRRSSIEAVIRDLEQSKNDLQAKINAMDSDHARVKDWLLELSAFDNEQFDDDMSGGSLQAGADLISGASRGASGTDLTQSALSPSVPSAPPIIDTGETETTEPEDDGELMASSSSNGPSKAGNLDPTLIAEYDNLNAELKEVQRDFDDTNGMYEHKLNLKNELKELDMSAPVQSSTLSALQDLWTRRNSRLADAERLAQEIEPQQEEYERLEQELSEKYQRLDAFTLDEANVISSLAVNMYKLQQEIQELQKELQEQTGRHLVKLMQTSKQHSDALDILKALNREEIEEAKNYSSLLVVFHEQIQEEQKKIQETKFSFNDIKERRKARRNSNLGKSIGVFVFSLILFIFLICTHDLPTIPGIVRIVSIALMLISLLVAITIFGMVLPPNYRYYLKDEYEAAKEQEAKHRKALNTAKTKVANLDAKLTAMAVKTGASSKEEMLKYITDASTHESVVEEHSTFEQSVGNQEARLKKMQKDLAYYFEKGGRDANEVDSQRAMDLAQDISQMYKEKEALDQQFQDIHNVRKQLDFLVEEIEGIDQEIRQRFNQSGIQVAAGVEALAEQIDRLTEYSSRRQQVLNELSRMEYELASYENVYDAIMSMDARKGVLKDRIRNLIEDNPALADLSPPGERQSAQAVLPWGQTAAAARPESIGSGAKPALAKKRAFGMNGGNEKKEELLVALRTQLNNRDEHYLEAIEELAKADHELVCARRAKLALEMARDAIRALSDETYKDWSDELNQQSGEIISQLGMDIKSLKFDRSLHLIVKLKGYQCEFNPDDIMSKLSTGMREQIHWLARIIVSRYLSKHQSLPIVLDEPFSEADDNRFLSMMRFLIKSVVPHNQIIIMSCHQQRHQWLVSQLQDEEREKLTFRRRQPFPAIEERQAEVISTSTS